jgi:hypothetical protein
MRPWTIGLASVLALFFVGPISATRAEAAAPRPWLCRDKPVFSSSTPMRYEATGNGQGRWLVTFMKFDPEGANDGFTIVASHPINAKTSSARGSLDPGQYFAVALYRLGRYWICPGYARDHDEVKPGVVSTLCYGRNSRSCDVKVTVLPADSAIHDTKGLP